MHPRRRQVQTSLVLLENRFRTMSCFFSTIQLVPTPGKTQFSYSKNGLHHVCLTGVRSLNYAACAEAQVKTGLVIIIMKNRFRVPCIASLENAHVNYAAHGDARYLLKQK
jgi:hypothetical protein